MVENELIYAHLLDSSIFLNPDEKQAIISGELDAYLARLKSEDQAAFAPVQESQDEAISPKEDSKQDTTE